MNSVNIPTNPIECKNYVSGTWIDGSGDTFSVLSPYNSQKIGFGRFSTKSDVDDALNAAANAHEKWKNVPLKERCQVMFRFRDILLSQLEVISHITASESGKTVGEAKAGLLKGIEVLEFALSLQNIDSGARMEVSRGVFCHYKRVPRGVVLGITPFNFPAMVPMWMIPIALTLGNSFVWKPSEKTPLTPKYIAEALKQAGLPDGALTILNGDKETVNLLLESPTIKSVGFVGSTPVAKSVYKIGSANDKRVLALGGAKNHIILMPDAAPEVTHKGIADSFTGCAGQRCMAASVLLAVGDCENHISGIVNSARESVLGKNMGAIISKDSLKRLNEAVSLAKESQFEILLDGSQTKPPTEFEDGHWFGPTIIDRVSPESPLAREELFGPILSIIRCKSLEEALSIENSNPFGNACSVFTQNGGVAENVAQNANAGMIGINIGVPVPREPFSFGGVFDSKFGAGDITGMDSLNLWSDQVKVTSKWADQTDKNWMS